MTAITDFDPAQLGDPSFLESLVPASAKVTLGEGERKELNLKIGGGSPMPTSCDAHPPISTMT